MKPLLFLFLAIYTIKAQSQDLASINTFGSPSQTAKLTQTRKPKTKPANYTALGYNVPLNAKDIVVGGTTTVYKKFGTFISYKVGIQNIMMPTHGERGEFAYDNVQKNGWTITGNTEQSVAWNACGGLSIAVRKKVPVYFGLGATSFREFFEYIDPTDGKPKWNVNDHQSKIELNYCAGIFVPLFGRVIMNVGYEHNPQCVFIGLGIRGLDVFRDADKWWWGADDDEWY